MEPNPLFFRDLACVFLFTAWHGQVNSRTITCGRVSEDGASPAAPGGLHELAGSSVEFLLVRLGAEVIALASIDGFGSARAIHCHAAHRTAEMFVVLSECPGINFV